MEVQEAMCSSLSGENKSVMSQGFLKHRERAWSYLCCHEHFARRILQRGKHLKGQDQCDKVLRLMESVMRQETWGPKAPGSSLRTK
jgi:hypothetical protein